MNKKGAMWGVLIIIFVVIVLIVITGIILANQERKTRQEEIAGNPNMILYLKIRDFTYNQSINGNYVIKNNTNYLIGNAMAGSFTEIQNISDKKNLEILCSSDKYYSELIIKNFTDDELKLKASKIECFLKPIGEIEVGSMGRIEEGERTITLNINSKGIYKNLGICTAWSGGIISVESIEKYNETEKPIRYQSITDRCFNTGRTLKDENLEIKFRVRSKTLNAVDKVIFYVFDNDWTYTNKNEILSENKGINLGNPQDKAIEIPYLGQESES